MNAHPYNNKSILLLLWLVLVILVNTHTQGGSVARVNTLQCVGGAAHHCAGGPYWDLSEGCVCVITAGPAGH